MRNDVAATARTMRSIMNPPDVAAAPQWRGRSIAAVGGQPRLAYNTARRSGHQRMNLQRLREAVRSAGREGLPPASARAYLFALACIGLAVLAHFAFAQLSADISPSILYNPAVFVAALVGGTRAGA